jgi:hypothetical protein
MGHATTNSIPFSQIVAEGKDAADGRKAERNSSGAASEEMKRETDWRDVINLVPYPCPK